MFDEAKAQRAVNFINCLKHTKGQWRGVPFDLLPWQDKIIKISWTVKEMDIDNTILPMLKFQRKMVNQNLQLQ